MGKWIAPGVLVALGVLGAGVAVMRHPAGLAGSLAARQCSTYPCAMEPAPVLEARACEGVNCTHAAAPVLEARQCSPGVDCAHEEPPAAKRCETNPCVQDPAAKRCDKYPCAAEPAAPPAAAQRCTDPPCDALGRHCDTPSCV